MVVAVWEGMACGGMEDGPHGGRAEHLHRTITVRQWVRAVLLISSRGDCTVRSTIFINIIFANPSAERVKNIKKKLAKSCQY